MTAILHAIISLHVQSYQSKNVLSVTDSTLVLLSCTNSDLYPPSSSSCRDHLVLALLISSPSPNRSQYPPSPDLANRPAQHSAIQCQTAHHHAPSPPIGLPDDFLCRHVPPRSCRLHLVNPPSHRHTQRPDLRPDRLKHRPQLAPQLDTQTADKVSLTVQYLHPVNNIHIDIPPEPLLHHRPRDAELIIG